MEDVTIHITSLPLEDFSTLSGSRSFHSGLLRLSHVGPQGQRSEYDTTAIDPISESQKSLPMVPWLKSCRTALTM